MQLVNSLQSKSRTLLLTLIIAGSAMFSTSCGDNKNNPEIPGVVGPQLFLDGDNLSIAMVFENIQIDGGLRYAIPKYNNSYIEVGPDLESDGTLMKVTVSLDDVFNGNLGLLPAQKLPGGRDLPGVSSGALPAVAFSIPKWKNMSFYLGKKFFGIFIPAKVDIGTNNVLNFRFYSGKIRAGNIALVGKDDQGENSGFVLLLDLNTTAAKYLAKKVD